MSEHDEVKGTPEETGMHRRAFLKRAAIAGAAIPAASFFIPGTASGMRIRDRARPYEGVTLQFAKAPHGTDEKDVIAKLFKPFTAKTGIEIKHTIVPWNVEGAAYATNYSGPNPYDVSYQTSTDLTSLGTKGVLEVLNTSQWLNAPSFASTKAKFIPSTIRGMTYQGKLWGLPGIIGGTVVFYNKDLLAKAGVTKIPTNTAELVPAAKKATDSSSGIWGFSVPMTDKDFNWYWHYHSIHNRGGDVVSRDFSKATFTSPAVVQATQVAVDLVLKHKAQPPVGQYDREGVLALFKAGRIGFLQEEPSRLVPFREAKLPFKWDFVNPFGAAGGKRTIFSTTGTWVMASKSKNKAAAWELVKFLSSDAFAGGFGEHYGWAPVRSDVDTAGGDPQVARVNKYVLTSWDGLRTHPKMAQIMSVYGQAIEAAATGSKSVQAAMARAQVDATRILKS